MQLDINIRRFSNFFPLIMFIILTRWPGVVPQPVPLYKIQIVIPLLVTLVLLQYHSMSHCSNCYTKFLYIFELTFRWSDAPPDHVCDTFLPHFQIWTRHQFERFEQSLIYPLREVPIWRRKIQVLKNIYI